MAEELPISGLRSDTPRLEATLTYLRAGFHPLPLHGIDDKGACSCIKGPDCRRKGKHPLSKNWETSQPTEKSLQQTFKQYPQSNIGLLMGGKARLVALDVDGEEGLASLRDLEAIHGQLSRTLTSRSGSGNGRHLVFTVPEGWPIEKIRNKVKVKPGLDVRAENGQIVVAPSRHVSGNLYEWVDVVPPAPLPRWLFDLMATKEDTKKTAPKKVSTPSTKGSASSSLPRAVQNSERVLKRASAYILKMPIAVQGQNGSGALYNVAQTLVGRFNLSCNEALTILRNVYNPLCQPPWGEAELRHKVEDADKNWKDSRGKLLEADGGNAGLRNRPPASSSPQEDPTPSPPAAKRLSTLPVIESIDSDSYQEASTIGDQLPVEDNAQVSPLNGHQKDSSPSKVKEDATPARTNPFEVLPFVKDRKYLVKKPQSRIWLLEREYRDKDRNNRDPEGSGRIGVLPLGKVGMLAAAGGVGKTMALCQFALAVGSGVPWLGMHVATPGHVLLALAEEDEGEVHRRLYNAMEAMKLTREQRELAEAHITALPLAGIPVALTEGDGRGNVTETEALKQLLESLHQPRREWRLIVLDPLSRWAGNDTEKDNAAATRFIQTVEKLVAVPGSPAVMLAHHTSKFSRRGETDDATAARGASGIVDGVRSVMILETDKDEPNIMILRFSKSNYSVAAPPIYLTRDNEYGGALRVMTDKEIKSYLDRKKSRTPSKPPAHYDASTNQGFQRPLPPT